ncbi:MAG: electron transfer flavoprotein subunit alpha/FixB family protein [Chloroflexi bacterium]|nr:electron transfer flavoprotein subunit alpha/FixB family protein [Chloroflexota bacterium]
MTGPVVVCTWAGEGEAAELLTLGRTVSEALGTDLVWLVIGVTADDAAETAKRYGATSIDQIDNNRVAASEPDATVEALSQNCSKRSPRMLLFSQTFNVRLIAPRLGGRLGSPVVMNATGIDAESGKLLRVTASAYGGDTQVVYEIQGDAMPIAALMPSAVEPQKSTAQTSPAVDVFEPDLSGVEERIRVLEPAHAEGPRLEDAQTIVAGGRGLGSPENFRLVEELAEALGGMPAASRPIVDDGWTDPSRQVGLTGKIARPALYIAAGISGASQHMAGCAASKTIVAINSDPDAAIFRYARYGIVGDCLELLPELTRAVQER